MSDDKTLAEALYGPRNTDKSADPPKHKMIWDTEPEEPKPGGIRDPNYELGKALYPNHLETALGHEFKNNMTHLRDHLGLTAEETAAMRQEHLSWLSGTVRDGSAPRVHKLLTQYTVTPATEEERNAWFPEAHRQVRELYGEQADRLLAKAQKLVRAKPAFAKALSESGVGNHPEVILAIIDRVRDAERRGQL